jgi:hypothetical protein
MIYELREYVAHDDTVEQLHARFADGRYQGGLCTRIGPISARYRGEATFVELDDVDNRAVIEARARGEGHRRRGRPAARARPRPVDPTGPFSRPSRPSRSCCSSRRDLTDPRLRPVLLIPSTVEIQPGTTRVPSTKE